MGALSWPEEALRANIIAQVSLALNRIWTEWYPSRGYSFNITGSPGYDQAYVNGRTVFAVMERLTAELFNDWKAWAEAAGEFVGSQRRFSDQLVARGVEKWRNTTGLRGFRGVGLKHPPTPAYTPYADN